MNKNSREYFVWAAAKNAIGHIYQQTDNTIATTSERCGKIACEALNIAESLVTEFENRYGSIPKMWN